MDDDETTTDPTVLVLPSFDRYSMDPDRLLSDDEWSAWLDHLASEVRARVERRMPATKIIIVADCDVEQTARMFNAATQRVLDYDTASMVDEIMGDVALSDWPLDDQP